MSHTHARDDSLRLWLSETERGRVAAARHTESAELSKTYQRWLLGLTRRERKCWRDRLGGVGGVDRRVEIEEELKACMRYTKKIAAPTRSGRISDTNKRTFRFPQHSFARAKLRRKPPSSKTSKRNEGSRDNSAAEEERFRIFYARQRTEEAKRKLREQITRAAIEKDCKIAEEKLEAERRARERRRSQARRAAKIVLMKQSRKSDVGKDRVIVDTIRARDDRARIKARNAALRAAKTAALEREELLESSRRRWDGGDPTSKDASGKSVDEANEEEGTVSFSKVVVDGPEESMTVESIEREKAEIEKILSELGGAPPVVDSASTLDVGPSSAPSSSTKSRAKGRRGRRTRKGQTAKKDTRRVVDTKKKTARTPTSDGSNKLSESCCNEEVRMLTIQFGITTERALESLRDNDGNLADAAMMLTDEKLDSLMDLS